MSEVAPDRLLFCTLDDWQAWQWRQQPLLRRKWREFRYRDAKEEHPLPVTLWNSDASSAIFLFAVDSHSPSHIAAVAEPLRRLIGWGVPVALVGRPPAGFPRGEGASFDELNDIALRATVSVGNHLALGARVKAMASKRGAPAVVVQHGALTPYAPPPAADDTVLAWSENDAHMWTVRQPSVSTRTVGSQMLWRASQSPRESSIPDSARAAGQVLFLGQLHGAELPRRITIESVRHLSRECQVIYRPHPAETDLLSSAQHRWWRSRGVRLDTSHLPSFRLRVPVLAHFSTGLLEAAVSGTAAYGFCAQAPTWVQGFWERYGIAEWGSGGETLVPIPSNEPAGEIAKILFSAW